MLNQPGRGRAGDNGGGDEGQRPQEPTTKQEALGDEERQGSARCAPTGDRGERKRMAKGKEVYPLPEGWELCDVPADGNCLFSAAGLSLKLMGRKRKVEPARLRAEMRSHVKRNEEKYKQMWDGAGADGASKTWDEYIIDIGTDQKKAGILELTATGRMYDCKFAVLHEEADRPWIAATVHNQGGKMGILVYDNGHYKAVAVAESGVVPDELRNAVVHAAEAL